MTKGLDSVFGLPSMDEILQETYDNDLSAELADDEMIVTGLPMAIESPESALIATAMEQITDHSKAMDTIYADTLKHAIDSAELAFDLDPARAPRMLEVSAVHYKTAMDAKNSKVDATMKMMKLINDQKKLDLDRQKLHHEMGNAPTDKADVVMVEDRNTLLKRLKEEAESKKD